MFSSENNPSSTINSIPSISTRRVTCPRRSRLQTVDQSDHNPQSMKRSRDRFLTTHTGSLPRPEDLIRMMFAKEEGVPVEPSALAARIREAVSDVIARQTAA